jgi:hypothetical protein
MPRNGSGTYTAPSNSANPAVPFTTISSTAHNAVLNDLVAALTDSLSRSGSGGMTAPLAMGANKITGLANGTLATDAVAYGQLGALAFKAAVDLSTADATGTNPVSKGGTGIATATAYAVLCGGTTGTGAFQNVSGVGTTGQVLTSNGAGALPSWQNAGGVPGKTLIQVDVLTVGSGTWNRPSGATSAEVYLWAGGGSGGSSASPAASQGSGGSGGGGGGFAYEYLTSLPNATENYTVGAGGAAPAAGANNGNSGSSSSFGTAPYLSATGGGGGTHSASTTNNFAAGGTPGIGSGGSVNMQGGAGGMLYIATAAQASVRYSGDGGASPQGGSGGVGIVGSSSSAGGVGAGPGAGGAGALSFNSGAAAAGGAGADGLIIVKSYG